MRDEHLLAEAVRLFEAGYGYEFAASHLGISPGTAIKWAYSYRALGKEDLLSGGRKIYSREEKLEAVRLFLDDGLTKSQVMERMGIRSKTALERWIRGYREGGADALAPRPKGRRPKAEPAYATREEELEARVRELELEVEILKRANALIDEIEQRRRRR